MEEFDSLIEMYEKGMMTRGELESKMIRLAATIHPQDYVPRLPPDLRQAIRDSHYVRSPPITSKWLGGAGMLWSRVPRALMQLVARVRALATKR